MLLNLGHKSYNIWTHKPLFIYERSNVIFECPIQPKKSSTYNYERILTYVHGTSYLPTFICPRVGFRNFYQYFLCVSFTFFTKFQFLFFFS